MSQDDLVKSAIGRFAKLGGLVARVGASVVADKAASVFRTDPIQQLKDAENKLKNAARIVETLGEMKGAAMKVGQMLSLHEAMLPPEVAAVLSALQQQAPSVSFPVMAAQVRRELPDFDAQFASLDPEPIASASIGQVYRGVLRDGRSVAVKVQYPDIDRVVRADLVNLKAFFASLIGMFVQMDFDEVWQEVRDRLLEELDYVQEADNMRRMAVLHADVPEIIVPRVVDEVCAERVLTMEFVESIGADAACSSRYPRTLKDRWGAALFEFVVRGLFEHHFLHADPNFANFGFRENGKVVVFDYGCMKRVDVELARGYASLVQAVLEDDRGTIPARLSAMGIRREKTNEPIPDALIDPFFEIAAEIVRDQPPYRFGDDIEIYEKLFAVGRSNWNAASDIVFPRDMVFIDRTLGGLFGNLARLGASAPWRTFTAERVSAHV